MSPNFFQKLNCLGVTVSTIIDASIGIFKVFSPPLHCMRLSNFGFVQNFQTLIFNMEIGKNLWNFSYVKRSRNELTHQAIQLPKESS